jgi:hypothetical protein
MRRYRPRFIALVAFAGSFAWTFALACSGSVTLDRSQQPPDAGHSTPDAALPDAAAPATGSDAGDAGSTDALDALQIEPTKATLHVKHGEAVPTVQFRVVNSRGVAVTASFQVGDGELGDVDDDGVFTPRETRGGVTSIEARATRYVLRAEVTIEVEWTQNGADADPSAGMPAGGYAGVGGEGPGGALARADRDALDTDASADAALRFVYPYDGTLFPLGLPAPLLMWAEGSASAADAIAVHLSGPHFRYRGYFGRPPPLAAGAPFVRHPIPEDVWDAATRTVAGGSLDVEVRILKAGIAYGPMTQRWKIARGSLKGTVYYQSYGTRLAENMDGAIGGSGKFGGATLAIRLGETAPRLVAGGDGGEGECRVCHSVSSDGSRMTVQHGDRYSVTSSYDLLAGNQETLYPEATNSQLAWIGMTPDGALGVSNAAPLGLSATPAAQLYDMATGDVVPSMGLAEFVEQAAFPAFSHDGNMLAFNFMEGPGNATIGAGDHKKLVAMDFDPMTRTFSNPTLLYEGAKAAGWPSFSPTGTALVYQVELTRGTEDKFFYTRYGATAELWWTNLRTAEQHRLEQANGTASGASYLPTGPEAHDADQRLNYEPSVAPIASGGYAWMVFTSRRLYGNVATIDPWQSDPREQDLSETPTTKKLWIAGIDLDLSTPELMTQVGDDPSHPAFYLPGQELLAGNARGFWVVDPCKDDGKGCESGVECCSGVCQKDMSTDELTCGPKTDDCVDEFGRCETAADCCDPLLACLNHVCTQFVVD